LSSSWAWIDYQHCSNFAAAFAALGSLVSEKDLSHLTNVQIRSDFGHVTQVIHNGFFLFRDFLAQTPGVLLKQTI
jgi:hypothetical protein